MPCEVVGSPIYTSYRPPLKTHLIEIWLFLLSLLRHNHTLLLPENIGERWNNFLEPLTLVILHRERVNKIFGKRFVRLLKIFIMDRPLPK